MVDYDDLSGGLLVDGWITFLGSVSIYICMSSFASVFSNNT